MAAEFIGSEFQVNTYTEERQEKIQFSINNSGESIAVWESRFQDGSGKGIYAQRYNQDGTPNGTEFLVNSLTEGWQERPAVKLKDNGEFIVSWYSYLHPTEPTSIYARVYSANGNPKGPDFVLPSSEVNRSYYRPSIDVDSNGNYLAIWGKHNGSNSSWSIIGRRFDSNGTPLNSEFEIADFDRNYPNTMDLRPDVSIGANGISVVTWTGFDHSSTAVYAQRLDANDNPIGNSIQVDDFTIGRQENSKIATDSNGNFVITWESDNQDGNGKGVYAQLYYSDGTPRGDKFRVNTVTSLDQKEPDVSMLPDGRFTITWTSRAGLVGNGDNASIYAKDFNSDGTPIGDEYLVNTAYINDQTLPSITTNDSGESIIGWQSNFFLPGSTGSNKLDLFAQRLDIASGHPQATPGDDLINGTGEDDLIAALEGNDTVFGVAGNDLLYGNQGEDSISGGSGDDTLYGNEGNDTLEGNSQNDTQYGGEGNDRLIDTHGHDFLDGGEGDDTLTSGDGSDILLAGNGNDSLEGGSGNDSLEGNDGNDTVHGGSGSDEVIGGLGNDSLTGHTGLDTLIGGEGNDTLRGGAGTDFLTGGLGRDVMNGEGGADTFFFTSPQDSLKTNPDRIIGHDYADIFDVSALGYTALEFDSTGTTLNNEVDVLRYYHSVTGSGEQRTYVVDDVDVFGFYVVGHLNFSSNDFTLA